MAQVGDTYDIVIVGAGVSGLYSAYKLMNPTTKKPTICVLEKLDRVGGLLKSDLVKIDGYEIKQEEGGMRFYKDSKVYELALELGLKDQIIDFSMGSEKNLNYFRGCRFTDEQAKKDKVWYKLFNTGMSKEEQDKYTLPDYILNGVFNKIRLENKAEQPTTPEEWQDVRLKWSFQGKKLYEWDFEYLLRKCDLSYETITMIAGSLGFKSLFNRNANAGFGFQSNLDFSSSPKFLTLKYGYDQIPLTLREKVVEQGVIVQEQSEVVKLDDEQGGEYPIRIEYNDNTNKPRTIRCRRCILALPKLALQSLASKNNWMNEKPNFPLYINSVISESLTKINLYFETQWWSVLGIDSGPNYTDLKLGTVYIFNPIKDPQERKLADMKKPGSLTIYCDYDKSFYWHSMQSIGGSYLPRDGVKPPENCVLAKKMVVDVALDQLTLLFQEPNFVESMPKNYVPIKIPPPVLATYTHWTEPRFGDSVHAWKVGSDDGIISPGMFSVLGDSIAIVGESYSLVQEWVEGALDQTNSYLSLFQQSMVPKK